MARILIVEDEIPLAETIIFNLKEEGYKVLHAKDGFSALDSFREFKPDIVLLDIMIPGIDGMEVCQIIRKSSDVPIIMLTAKSSELDKVLGLGIGADDYITKPFSLVELVARVKSALRRYRGNNKSSELIISNGVEMDLASHTVKVNDTEVELTPKEYELLHILISNKGRVLERNVLLDRVWGEDEYIDPGTVDVHIRRLRQKIEQDPSSPKKVITIRGIGYKFSEKE